MYTNILVPISFDDDTKARAAIAVAKALLGDGGRMTLLHVMEQIPNYAISYVPKDYLTQSQAAIQAELDDLAATAGQATGLVVHGHSGRTILDWAEENGTDCIVIASHRPGMQDLLLGSTAAKVVRHATCAVHVLR